MPVAPALSLVPDRTAGLADVDLGARVWQAPTRALLDDLALPRDARVVVVEDVLGGDAALLPDAGFDLVHARFQLCRHGRAAEQLAAFRRLLAPGGTLLVEEPDLRTWAYEPHAPATAHLIGRGAQAFAAAGGNLDAGRRLPAAMRAAGLTPRVRTHAVGLEAGHPYLRFPLDLAEALADRLADVLGTDGLDHLRATATTELLAPGRRGTTFTLVQAWARVAPR
jgi:SAM-dependent methyltransferase